MMRSTPILAAVLLLGLAGTAHAQISYNYLHAAAIDGEIDTGAGSIESIGADVGASIALMRRLHVFASYELAELDDFPSLETERVTAGVGYHGTLSDTQSVYVNVSFLNRNLDIPTDLGTFSIDEDGYGLSVGFRESNGQRLEFLASLDFVDYEDSDESDATLFTSMQYHVTERLRVEGGVRFAGDDQQIKIGVRYYLPSWINAGD